MSETYLNQDLVYEYEGWLHPVDLYAFQLLSDWLQGRCTCRTAQVMQGFVCADHEIGDRSAPVYEAYRLALTLRIPERIRSEMEDAGLTVDDLCSQYDETTDLAEIRDEIRGSSVLGEPHFIR